MVFCRCWGAAGSAALVAVMWTQIEWPDLVYRWNLAGVDRRRLGARGQRSTFHDQAIPNRQTAEQGSCPLVEVWLPNQVLAKIESKPKYCYGFFRGTVKCENDRSARGKWTRGLQSVCVPA